MRFWNQCWMPSPHTSLLGCRHALPSGQRSRLGPLLRLSLAVMLLTVACSAPSMPASGGGTTATTAAAPRIEKHIVYGTSLRLDVRPTAGAGRAAILPLIGSGLTTTDGQGNRL